MQCAESKPSPSQSGTRRSRPSHRLVLGLILALLVLAGYVRSSTSVLTAPTEAPATAIGRSAPTGTPTRPIPTATAQPTATRTALPTSSPTPSATPTPTPDPRYGRLATYAVALRPTVWQRFVPATDPQAFEWLASMTTYSLTVTLAPDLTRLSGTARIGYTNQQTVTLDAIYLHLYPNLWGVGLAVTGAEAAGRAVTPTVEADATRLRVPLPIPLSPRMTTDLVITYTSPILTGEGAGNYGEFALDRGILSLGHSYPVVAVYDGGWRLDTPPAHGDVTHHAAALYDVALTGPQDLLVAATGETLSKALNADGSATWHIVGGPLRDFNVIASADYRVLRGAVGDITVNSYFLPGHESGGQKALNWAMAALTRFENEFGAYPYRELDVAAMPTKAGGLEYPGLIAITTRVYGNSAEDLFFESVTAHEVAHQWWYNVVGNDQVNHPWLDEALAQYSVYRYVLSVYGAAGGQNFVDTVTHIRWGKVGYAEKPIGLPTASYTDEEYSGIIYGRGPLFLLALRDRMGETKMAEFLRRYYAAYAWRIATPDGFRRLAEEVAGENLGELFERWVE